MEDIKADQKAAVCEEIVFVIFVDDGPNVTEPGHDAVDDFGHEFFAIGTFAHDGDLGVPVECIDEGVNLLLFSFGVKDRDLGYTCFELGGGGED